MDLARTNTKIGANIVIESIGLFLTKETAQKWIIAGAKKAIMFAPSKDDTLMFVYGVSHCASTLLAADATGANAAAKSRHRYECQALIDLW